MDAVITYVNGLDPLWQESYRKAVPSAESTKRFRDWGTLKYLLRGIVGCMPFVEKVHLVVASASQVPDWVDDSKLRVVLHEDIIPSHLLPVFNSCTIEMFLHRIPNLAEEFVYFNDDMFPLRPCVATELFRDGKAVIGFSRHLLSPGMYKRQCRTSDRLARKALGLSASPFFMRPQHICSPMLRSASEQLFEWLEPTILATASRMRTPQNPNQYLFLDYLYYSGKVIPQRISNTHISQGVWSAEKIADFILHPTTTFACINDVDMPDARFKQMQKAMLDAFEKRFPDKSPYEI